MIRLANQNDFPFIYNLYMHPAANPFLLYELMCEESFRPIFNGLLQQGVKYVYTSDEQPTGMFKLIPLQYRTSHITYLGGLAIEPALSRNGAGSKMLREIIDFAGRQGFLRIELSVADINEKAIHLYEKAGFQKEGVLRKYSHLKSQQRFMDEIMMSYIF